MKEKTLRMLIAPVVTFTLLVVATQSSLVAAQERSKDIGVVVPSEDVVERPAKSSTRPGNKPSVAPPRRSVTYRSSKRFTKAHAPNMEYVQLGVTVWRLLKQDGSDPKERCEEAQLLSPLEGDDPLGIGSMIRIGIEPLTRDGFLYVIDREQFADGTYGTPKLIFPKLNIRDGNPWVRKGELVLVPKTSCFRITQSTTGRKQIAEVLTFIASPTPLELPAPLAEKAMPLSDELFKRWERQWSAPVTVLKMNVAATTTSLKAETEGTKDLDDVQDAQQLTEEDPKPRTVYRMLMRRGGRLLVTVPLRFKAVP